MTKVMSGRCLWSSQLPTAPESHTHTIAQLQRVPRESPEKCCAGQCSKPLLSTLAYVSWVSAKAEQGHLKSLCLFHQSLDQSSRCDDCEVLWRCWGLGCVLNGKLLLNEEFTRKMLVYSNDSVPLASAGIYWTSTNCLQQARISMR